MLQTKEMSAALLAWYDANARDLPWRVGPSARARGVRPDPYRVWLSEVMLQQTTVAAVERYFRRFTALWPDVQALAAASDAQVMGEWAGLGYYARARNLLKCARVVADDLAGAFPRDEAALRRLPGIGPYTAAAVAAIAFDRPAVVVDGNVERVMARLFAVEETLDKAKPRLRALAGDLTPRARAGDHAQAVMDLGATVCTVRAPACADCPLRAPCRARAAGIAAELPRRTPRRTRPVRRGIVHVARRADGAVLLERRPGRGLLGGMLGWPGDGWDRGRGACEGEDAAPPVAARWRTSPVEVRHTFTHFHLILTVRHARVPADARPSRGQFVAAADFDPADLPTVMRKAWDAARAAPQDEV